MDGLASHGVQDDVLLQMYGTAILEDHGSPPTYTVEDLFSAATYVQNMKTHLHTTEHKEGRWLSWYVHARRLNKQWHSLSGAQF